jgi:nucleoside-diphosphate-sugar epimerase
MNEARGERPIREPILVTGATGFIGRRLVKRLRDDGYAPRAFALPDDTIPAEWGDAVSVLRGDVSHRAQVMAAMRDIGTVFHLAAMVGDWGSAAEHERITVRGTEHVLTEAARSGARAILASSVVVYGDALGSEVCDEHRPMGRPLGAYSRSKQAQERIAHQLEAQASLKVTIVRPCNVFGPGSRPWVDMVVAQLQASEPTLVGDGRRCAALTYVDNVVDVFVRAASSPAAVGRAYNANDDNHVTWLRYFTELALLSGSPEPQSVPNWLAGAAARGYEGCFRLLRKSERPPITREALNLVGSHHRVPIERARRELGYDPPVSYADGMKAVAEYLQQGSMPV